MPADKSRSDGKGERVYSKFRVPDLADISNMRPGVSRDRILEAWLVTRLSIDQAVYREGKNQLYFCDTARGETGDVIARSLKSMGVTRSPQRVQVDSLGAIYVGMKVVLHSEELPTVMVALKLEGIRVERVDL